MSEQAARCAGCGAVVDVDKGRRCWPCVERLVVLSEQAELRLVEMFGLSRRSANILVKTVPLSILLSGEGAPEGRCVMWIEQAHDSEISSGSMVGPKTLAEIRAAIPRRDDGSVICSHCGGSGRVSGRIVVA